MKYRYQKRNMSHIPESRNLLKASDEKLISEPDESLLVIYKIKYPIQNVYSFFKPCIITLHLIYDYEKSFV